MGVDSGIVDDLKTIGTDVLSDYPVDVAYLYGSVAKEVDDEISDVDIGVLFSDDSEEIDIITEIMRRFNEEFSEREIDIRSLNTDDIVFKYEVIKDGVPIYVADEDKRVEFEFWTSKIYLDMKPYIERYYKVRKERIEEKARGD